MTHLQIIRSSLVPIRNFVLRQKNRIAISKSAPKTSRTSSFLMFVIASPADMHLAPKFFESFDGQDNFHVIANGIDTDGVRWLQSKLPNTSISSLSASLTGNRDSFLAHGDVIDLIADHFHGDFFICDADCLITKPDWLRQEVSLPENAYATGPFGKETALPGFRMPDTFLVMLNSQRYKAICKRYKITARITDSLTPELQSSLLKRHGIRVGRPERGKNYVDTLQQFWVAGDASEYVFHEIPGAGETFFHVGGSSYLLNSSNADLTHWDYWPANTIYFHLRFLETCNDAFLQQKLNALTNRYGNSSSFLEANTGLHESARFKETLKMLAYLFP